MSETLNPIQAIADANSSTTQLVEMIYQLQGYLLREREDETPTGVVDVDIRKASSLMPGLLESIELNALDVSRSTQTAMEAMFKIGAALNFDYREPSGPTPARMPDKLPRGL